MTPEQPEQEQNQGRELTIQVEVTRTPQQQRNFVIPGCATTICCTKEEGLSVDQLLSIVFSLAHSNPVAKVDFWIKVMPE